MCGIAGIYYYGRTGAVSPDKLAAMRAAMVHRGPDDAGIFISEDRSLGLAHQRLSIIDLSAAGHQPMADATGRYHVVFNGEIYNFRELRAELEKEGIRFRSHSDTEVLLHLYPRHGTDMLDRLRGMFAFAIWDNVERRLFVARDRLGVKPLYFAASGGRFYFASEIKALLATGDLERRVNHDALYHYLSFLTTPAPQTLFEGIRKLPAAHYMTVDSSGVSALTRWWSPLHPAPDKTAEPESLDQIRSLLRESVRYRMVSDVPCGVFLSGGIDSSTNVALMAELMDRPVDTFSIGFKSDERYNELGYARLVADRFNARHHEVEIGMDDLMRFLPEMVYHQDEPIADPVCIPVYYVAKLARDYGVTVCQVGEGSDELFCGYPYWSYVLRLEKMRQWYSAFPRPLRELASLFARQIEAPSSGRLEYLRRASSDEPVFWGGAEAFFETHKRRLLHRDLREKLHATSSASIIASYFRDFVADGAQRDTLSWMTFIDLNLRLPELLLMRVDKMTMATSVEARVPFLDHKLVECVLNLPQSLKVPQLRTKHLLKQAVRGIIPDEIIDRPKQGFGVPVVEWFQQELGAKIRQTLQQFNSAHRYFDSDELDRVLQMNHSALPWYLFNFALWHEMWIEQKQMDVVGAAREC